MELVCYHLMSCRAKRRLISRQYKRGQEIPYKPHTRMVKRIQKQLGWTQEAVRRQIFEERMYLMKLDGII